MLGIVVASYFCFYAPITSTYFYEMVSGKPVPTAYRLVTLLIVTMNNANNPIVYGLMNSNFRVCKRFLACSVREIRQDEFCHRHSS